MLKPLDLIVCNYSILLSYAIYILSISMGCDDINGIKCFIKHLTKHHLEFLSLKDICTGSSEPTLVIMTHCWKSHVVAQIKRTVGKIMCVQLAFIQL